MTISDRRSAWPLLLGITLLVAGCAEEEPERLWGSGALEAEEVLIASTIGGRLLVRTVDEGDRVREGELTALVDTTALVEARDLARVGLEALSVERRQAETALSAAVEQLEQAVRNRDRVRVLVETAAATRAQLDDLNSLVDLARRHVEAADNTFHAFPVREREIRLRIASLERQIRECRLTAPRSGTVLTVYSEPGEVVGPGRGIVRIADLTELFVRVYIPAPLVGRVELGGEALLRVDSFPDRTFQGRVVYISEEAEFTPKNVQTPEARADLVFAVKVSVPNPEGFLKIGLPVDVELPEIMP